MDILQTAVKTFFYDVNPERVYRIIALYEQNAVKKLLLGSLEDIGKNSNCVFTSTEIRNLKDFCSYKKQKLCACGLPYELLCDLVNEILECDGTVLVRYKHLLRWQRIASLLGEDIPVSVCLAINGKSSDFIWPDTLEHDEPNVNAMLSEGVADIHSHLNGSYAAFELGWINRMNRMNTSVSDNPFGGKTKNIFIDHTFGDLDYFGWMIIAARIRILLFKALRYKNYDTSTAIGEIIKLHDNTAQRTAALRSLITDASSLAINSKKCDDAYNRHWDYALENVSGDVTKSPYLTLRGERWLSYTIIKEALTCKQAKNLLPLLYLYHVIKIYCRKEMILTNGLIGLSNFQSFEKGNYKFLQKAEEKVSVSDMLIFRYAVKTALGDSLADSVELRCNLSTFDKLHKYKLYQNIFDSNNYIDKNFLGYLSFVSIFSKSVPLDVLHDVSLKLIQYRKYNNKRDARDIPYLTLTGIDVGGNDANNRPEYFAQAYRFCKGKCGRTFHIGEDYVDAVDSLRYLDEAYTFFELQRGDRIGHALVLGEDIEDFYYKRNYTVLLPRINLIDSIVWLICRSKELNIAMDQGFEETLEKTAQEHYSHLSLNIAWSITDYWHSMLIRSNTNKDPLQNAEYARCGESKNQRCSGNETASTIWSKIRNEKNRTKEFVQFVWPREVLPVITSLQEALLRKFQNKGVVIESCPTSNRMIGHFDRYDEHPLFKFEPLTNGDKHPPRISINTDERGIFATSIRREYSLMCLAIEKKLQKDHGYSEAESRSRSIDYMTRIMRSAKLQFF